jgi:hypothetical protein
MRVVVPDPNLAEKQLSYNVPDGVYPGEWNSIEPRLAGAAFAAAFPPFFPWR